VTEPIIVNIVPGVIDILVTITCITQYCPRIEVVQQDNNSEIRFSEGIRKHFLFAFKVKIEVFQRLHTSLALVAVMERSIQDTRSLLELIIQTITAALTTIVSFIGNSLVRP